jgi:hypothetical protein
MTLLTRTAAAASSFNVPPFNFLLSAALPSSPLPSTFPSFNFLPSTSFFQLTSFNFLPSTFFLQLLFLHLPFLHIPSFNFLPSTSLPFLQRCPVNFLPSTSFF